MKNKILQWLGKYIFLKLARFCLYHSRGNWCWICGCHAGMGPFWGGKMTCWDCYNKWKPFHKPHSCPNMIVDWKGLGRIV